MAWITSSGLAAAVSDAGGLGVLGTSADFTEIVRGIPENVEAMRQAIRRTKELTDKPFGINVFPAAADPYGFSKAMIDLAKEEGVELNEEQLEAVSGGACTSSTKCPECGCRTFNWHENDRYRTYTCARCHAFVYTIYFGK